MPIVIRHRKQTAPQREFWGTSEKFRLFVGGVGSGKTRAGVVEAMRQPAGSTGMVLAPTYPMLRDATLRTFLELTAAAGVLDSFNKAEMVATLKAGRTILFRSSDNPDRLRGPNLGWFWLDEAAMMSRETWLIMLGRLREAPGRAWCTTTPRGKNWLYREFTRDDDKHRIVRASSRTNPFLPADFVESLLSTYDDHFAAQEVDGEFLDENLGGLFKEFWVDRLPAVAAECDRLRKRGKGGRRFLAADLGEGTGRDRTVVGVRDHLGLLALEASDRVGIPEAAVLIDRMARQFGVRQEDIRYDAGGRGKDLPRYLEHHRITEAYPYFGSGKGGPKHANKRARSAWNLRQRLDPERPEPVRRVEPPPDYKPSDFAPPPPTQRPAVIQPPFGYHADAGLWPGLAEELKTLRYSLDGPKIKLETKEDMAKRLGRSPDLADCLLMLFALPPEDE